MEKVELKPCPFCGGEAVFVGETSTIKCVNCGGAFLCTNPLISRFEVAHSWNRRNDAIDELTKVIDDEAILALKAVVYGCNTNRRLVCGHFAHNINDPDKMQTIEFAEAIQISSLVIEKLISMFGGETK